MIIGIGIDSVEIQRFIHWHTFPKKQLTRIFSAHEIDYCLTVPIKSAERFAVRFAAREAFFKAFQEANTHAIPFLTICKQISVKHSPTGSPLLNINWAALKPEFEQSIIPLLSLTHTASAATAIVMLQQR
jgi:holo-[acyl-carrier protein] synthase